MRRSTIMSNIDEPLVAMNQAPVWLVEALVTKLRLEPNLTFMDVGSHQAQVRSVVFKYEDRVVFKAKKILDSPLYKIYTEDGKLHLDGFSLDLAEIEPASSTI